MLVHDQDLLKAFAPNRLFKHLDKAKKQSQALGMFEWMDENNEFGDFDTKDPYLYAQLIRMFSHTRQLCPKALQIFEGMETRGVKPDVAVYNAAINAAGELAMRQFPCSCCDLQRRLDFGMRKAPT